MNKNISFKKIKESAPLIPVVAAFLIFCGFLYSDVYFSIFKIRIVRYVELSEIMLLFLNEGYFFLSSIALILLLYFVFELVFPENARNNLKSNVFFRKNILRYSLLIIYLALSIFIFYWFIPGTIKLPSKSMINLFQNLSSVSLILLLIVLIIEFVIEDKKSMTIQLISIVVGLTSYSGYHGAKNAADIITKNHLAIIKTDKEVISSQATTCYYIGKTNNYVFFYYLTGDSTKIIPVASIREMTFKF